MILLLENPEETSPPSSTLPETMNYICIQASGDHMILSINERALLQASFGRNPPPPPVIIHETSKWPPSPAWPYLGSTLHQYVKWDTHIEGIILKDNARSTPKNTFWSPWNFRKPSVNNYLSSAQPSFAQASNLPLLRGILEMIMIMLLLWRQSPRRSQAQGRLPFHLTWSIKGISPVTITVERKNAAAWPKFFGG